VNRIDNANSKPALTKQFKTIDGGAATKEMKMTVKQVVEKHQETSRRELVNTSSTVLVP